MLPQALAFVFSLFIVVPAWAIVLAGYALMSCVTLAVYAADKSAASRGGRRVSERTLHLLELLGGWPGAIVAMSVMRHKRRKREFVTIVWLIALLHIVGWAWWLGVRRG